MPVLAVAELAALAALPVPPVPPVPPPVPVPVPVTCWPTVRLTEATVPAMVDVSAASLSAVWALESDDSAEVTAAWSESIVVVAALEASSAARRASAEDSWACAALTSSESAVVFTVASTSPAVTVWPALTLTAVTVPDTPKLRLAWLAGSIVPELATVCWIVPVLTETVCVVTTRPVGVDEPDVSQYREAACAGQHDDHRDDDDRPVPTPEGPGLRVELRLVAQWQLLGEVDRIIHPCCPCGHVCSSAQRFHNEPKSSCEPAWGSM